MKTLVFVHGYFGGSSQWAEQVALFSAYFNVVTVDLPGFGLKNKLQSPDTIRGYAEFVLKQVEHQGVERFHLVGHSMGGMIAQEMATIAPSRIDQLVLYGTGPVGLMPGRFETIQESKRRVVEDGSQVTGQRIAATWFMQGETASQYQLCADLAIMASQQAALAGLTAMESWSGVSSLSHIKTLTLVLWGDGDRAYQWSQPEQLWKGIEDTQLAVIPGCSHAVHLEKPGLFNVVLMDFFGIATPQFR